MIRQLIAKRHANADKDEVEKGTGETTGLRMHETIAKPLLVLLLLLMLLLEA